MKLSREELLERKRVRERIRRERIKSDPLKYVEFKAKDLQRKKKAKREGKILPVSELPSRQKMVVREKGRARAKKHYYKKKNHSRVSSELQSNSPSTSDDENPPHSSGQNKRVLVSESTPQNDFSDCNNAHVQPNTRRLDVAASSTSKVFAHYPSTSKQINLPHSSTQHLCTTVSADIPQNYFSDCNNASKEANSRQLDVATSSPSAVCVHNPSTLKQKRQPHLSTQKKSTAVSADFPQNDFSDCNNASIEANLRQLDAATSSPSAVCVHYPSTPKQKRQYHLSTQKKSTTVSADFPQNDFSDSNNESLQPLSLQLDKATSSPSAVSITTRLRLRNLRLSESGTDTSDATSLSGLDVTKKKTKFNQIRRTSTPVNLIDIDSSAPATPSSCPEKVNTIKPPKKLSPTQKLRRFKYKSQKQTQILQKELKHYKNLAQKYRKQIAQFRRRIRVSGSQFIADFVQEPQRQEIVENVSNNEENLNCASVSILSESENVLLSEENNVDHKLNAAVIQFFEDDENSRVCPGKRDTVTKNKIKKQKRILSDTLQNLHEKFVKNHQPVSYSYFCKMRPFWVQIPNINKRDTCLCKIHENIDLMIKSLCQNNIIIEKTAKQVKESLCCDPTSVDCLMRDCEHCRDKRLVYLEFDNSKDIEYSTWKTEKVNYTTKDGLAKSSNQTAKVQLKSPPKTLLTEFENLLWPYLQHCGRIGAQYSYIRNLKANLTEEECIVHCDFSENFLTKYASEIQSFHFGGSRQQITLHTVVVYYVKEHKVVSQCICTLSNCLRHDAVAIWEHLMPILRFIEDTVPQVTIFHFLSDSPSAQYRNRKMFFIMSKLHWAFPSMRRVEWNYSESGHGKGAPDGVGGTVKRTADRIIAEGKDIPDLDTLVTLLKENVPGIQTEVVPASNIYEKDMLVPKNLPDFVGTMKVHQAIWDTTSSHQIEMRKLSCLDCSHDVTVCKHGLHIGFYDLSKQKQTAKRKKKDKNIEENTHASNKENTNTDNHEKKTLYKNQQPAKVTKRKKPISSTPQEKKKRCNDNEELASEILFDYDIEVENHERARGQSTYVAKQGTSVSLGSQKIVSIDDGDRAKDESLNLTENDTFWTEVPKSVDFEKLISASVTNIVLNTLATKNDSDSEGIFD